MFPLFKKSKKKKNTNISAAEAFNLWDILNSVYAAIERFNLWANYIHDPDFQILMQVYLKELHDAREILENALTQYGIKASDAHTLNVNTDVNSDFMRDQLIATDLYSTQQEHIEMLLIAIAQATRNDQVRSMLIRFVKKSLDRIGMTTKYLKVKGWLQSPPIYSQTPGTKLKIDAGEVFNLWSHLTYRYDNLMLTETFLALVNDIDLKLFLKKAGYCLLKRQRPLKENSSATEWLYPLSHRRPSPHTLLIL